MILKNTVALIYNLIGPQLLLYIRHIRNVKVVVAAILNMFSTIYNTRHVRMLRLASFLVLDEITLSPLLLLITFVPIIITVHELVPLIINQTTLRRTLRQIFSDPFAFLILCPLITAKHIILSILLWLLRCTALCLIMVKGCSATDVIYVAVWAAVHG